MSAVSKRIYKQADRIAVTSPLFDEYFSSSLGIERETSAYLPQYADDAFSDCSRCPCEGYDPAKTNLTFAGNVGQAQSVLTIVEAASILQKESNLVFHVVGSGSRLEQCKARATELGLNNIVFHGRKPIEDMPRYYSASDAMIVTFEDSPMATYTLPRKVTTYMAAGKPILAALSGETKRVIDDAKCGFCCDIEDAKGLARIASQFAGLSDTEQLGNNAKAYYERYFTKKLFFDKLEKLLTQLVED